LLFTGQHPLAARDYGLCAYPKVEIGCPGGGDPERHVRAVVGAFAGMLHRAPPGLVMVQGDTSSALGGALAAAIAGVPLAHVEAGLRSHDRKQPWPEEDFRIAIDEQAQLLFAPTALAAANLRRERVRGEVHVTGNTAIDAIASAGRDAGRSGPRRLLVTCHRRENWGEGMRSVAAALRRIAADRLAEIDVLLHPNPLAARQMLQWLGGVRRIRLLPPCSHSEMLRLMAGCDLLLSDSGGVQEEAPALGIPLLVLRDRTERPEAVASGNAILVGTDRDLIVDTVHRLLGDPAAFAAMARPSMPFGTQGASDRVAAIVEKWIADRSDDAVDQASAWASRTAARTASA
jgi:UDP-N-acetylglucosamine 2-epimerase (non-hydrolysing)